MQLEAQNKIKDAENKAKNEKLKAEEVIKQATKMILEARSKKSEIKSGGAAQKHKDGKPTSALTQRYSMSLQKANAPAASKKAERIAHEAE